MTKAYSHKPNRRISSGWNIASKSKPGPLVILFCQLNLKCRAHNRVPWEHGPILRSVQDRLYCGCEKRVCFRRALEV
jgi:hypothetical protein